MRSFLTWLAALGLGAALIALGGCTGTDVITIDVGNLEVELQVTNFAQTRFERGTLTLSQVRLRPTDPAASAALGTEPIGPMIAALGIDLTQPGLSIQTAPLHSGTYVIESLAVPSVTLIDDNPPANSPRCVENVVDPGADRVLGTGDDFSTLPDPRSGVRIGDPQVNLTNFGGATVTVQPGTGGRLVIRIDAVMLAQRFEQHFLCRFANNNRCTSLNPLEPPYTSRACLDGFDRAAFALTAPDFVSFQ